MVIYETKLKGLNHLHKCNFCFKEFKTIWYKYEDTEKKISIEYTTFGICKRCLNKKIKEFVSQKQGCYL